MPMQYIHINFWSVLIAAIIGMALEMAWYSPKAFGRLRTKILGRHQTEFSEEKDNANLIISFVSILIMSYILSYAIFFSNAANFYDGLSTAFYIWLGFIATTSIFSVLWEERSLYLCLIENGFRLLSLAIMGGILAIWR